MSPEKCHHDFGTCRDPQWGMDFCMTDHVVYGQLVGHQGRHHPRHPAADPLARPGCEQALPIMRVATRQQSGMVEDLLRSSRRSHQLACAAQGVTPSPST